MADTEIVALPAVVNFTVLKGDTFEYKYIFTDENSIAFDLTTLTSIKMQIRKKPGGVDILWSASVGSGMVISGLGNNELTISKTVDINAGAFAHDLQLEYSNGKIWTPTGGSFTVKTDVTV